MRTVVLGPRPPELDALIARREGHADFNLGEPGNYRIPDGGLIHCEVGGESFVPTAALVIEVRSPDDETMLTFDHYAAHGVGEVLVADPDEQAIEPYVLEAALYSRRDMSPLLGATVAEVAACLRWPQRH